MHAQSYIVWHLSRDLAVAAGLGSNEEHMFPLVDATCGGSRTEDAVKVLWNARCYEPVAMYMPDKPVDTGKRMTLTLEWLFEHTNNITDSWWTVAASKGIRVMRRGCGYRSTSVGDVVQVNDNHTTRLFRVASIGWVPLGQWEPIKDTP